MNARSFFSPEDLRGVSVTNKGQAPLYIPH